MNFMYIVLAIIAVIALVAVYKKWKAAHIIDINIPEPQVLRKDLRYGYYGCEVGADFHGQVWDQPQETIGHVNLFWESQFRPELTVQNILKMKMPTVLDVTPQTMIKIEPSGRNFHYVEEAPARLRSLFNQLKAANALQYIHAIYPMDEPNTNTTEEDLQKAINAVRSVAKEFPELDGLKLVCIYAAKPFTFECFNEFDYVGIDDYDAKSTIFVNGTYGEIKSRLAPHQKTVILPGGAFGQDPKPFINFAHSNPEVAAVVPFCWFGAREERDTWIGIGDPKNGRRQQYINAGEAICALTTK